MSSPRFSRRFLSTLLQNAVPYLALPVQQVRLLVARVPRHASRCREPNELRLVRYHRGIQLQLLRLLVAPRLKRQQQVGMRYHLRGRGLGQALGPVGLGGRHGGFQHLYERVQAFALEVAGELGQIVPVYLREVMALRAHNGEHQFGGHHLVGRAVHRLGLFLAPFPHVLEQVQAARVEQARARDAPGVLLYLRGQARMLYQRLALLHEPRHAPHLLQLFHQYGAKLVQVERVVYGVLAHVQRERPYGPVGALVFLLEFLAKVLVYQVGKAQVLLAQHLGGEHRVENLLGRKAVGLPQQSQVVVGAVENQGLHGLRLEQRRNVEAAERVHYVVVLPDGNLYQAQLGHVMVHGIGLRVHGGHLVQVEVLEEPRQGFLVVDQYVLLVLQHYTGNVTKKQNKRCGFLRKKRLFAPLVRQTRRCRATRSRKSGKGCPRRRPCV